MSRISKKKIILSETEMNFYWRGQVRLHCSGSPAGQLRPPPKIFDGHKKEWEHQLRASNGNKEIFIREIFIKERDLPGPAASLALHLVCRGFIKTASKFEGY